MRAATTNRLLLALIALGIVVRLASLSLDSLWLDEALSVRLASRFTAAELWRENVDPRHPPLYYVLLQDAMSLQGNQTEFAVRLPSAMASLASLGLVYVLGLRLVPGRQASLLAVALLAWAPLDLWYAGEARMYALATLAGLVVALGLATDRWLGSLLVFAGLTVGLYTSYVTVPLWVGLTALWLVRWRVKDRRPATLALTTAAMALAWWLYRSQWPHLARLLEELDEVFLFRRLGRLDLTGLTLIGGALLAGLAVFGGGELLRRALVRPSWRRWLAPIILAGFGIASIALALPRLYTVKRVLVVGWPYVVLLAVWVTTRLEGNQGSRAGLARPVWLLALVSLIAGTLTVAAPRDDWRGVVAALDERVPADAVVWVDPYWNLAPYETYAPEHPAAAPKADGSAGIAQAAATTDDIWLVAERFGGPPPSSPSERWLDTNWELVEAVQFARLEVRRYQAPP